MFGGVKEEGGIVVFGGLGTIIFISFTIA